MRRGRIIPAWLQGRPTRAIISRNLCPDWLAEGRRWRLGLMDHSGLIGRHETSKWTWTDEEAEEMLRCMLWNVADGRCPEFPELIGAWETLVLGSKARAIAYKQGIFWDAIANRWVQ